MGLATTDESESDSVQQGGLGFLDPSKAVLQLDIVLKPDVTELPMQFGTAPPRPRRERGRLGGRIEKKTLVAKEVAFGIQVQQDLSALKGRKGDTGERTFGTDPALLSLMLTYRQCTLAQ